MYCVECLPKEQIPIMKRTANIDHGDVGESIQLFGNLRMRAHAAGVVLEHTRLSTMQRKGARGVRGGCYGVCQEVSGRAGHVEESLFRMNSFDSQHEDADLTTTAVIYIRFRLDVECWETGVGIGTSARRLTRPGVAGVHGPPRLQRAS